MKKFMLSLLILAGAFTAVLSFHACSADEEADEPQHCPQAQLLLQKSREFAKKYNVNMTLNKDNIEETVKTLSVEEMEKDYREWAGIKCTIKLTEANPRFKKSANKLRINRRKVSYEETNINGEFKGPAKNNEAIKVEVSYNLGNKGSGLVHAAFLKSCRDFRLPRWNPADFVWKNAGYCRFTYSRQLHGVAHKVFLVGFPSSTDICFQHVSIRKSPLHN